MLRAEVSERLGKVYELLTRQEGNNAAEDRKET
jgi:hypothetical protein